ncbi:MAG: glycosyltransferase family 25 protein [Bacteroidota bacterium]|nr:glycosyltransferase family 25 protein [Bacteroidota bacterium]
MPKHILNKYFDHIYILTIESAADRRKKITQSLDGVDYTFFYGINKYDIDIQEWIAKGKYDVKKAVGHSRFNYKMSTGQIACAEGHKNIYAKIIADEFQKVLILEDDSILISAHLQYLSEMIEALPSDWDIFYLDYDMNESNDLFTWTKQQFYKMQRLWGGMKFNHKMIDNYFSRPYNKLLRKSGYHYFTNAYAVNEKACRVLLDLQTPIVFPSDHALAWGISNELLKGYNAVPKIFEQSSAKDNSKTSMIFKEFKN